MGNIASAAVGSHSWSNLYRCGNMDPIFYAELTRFIGSIDSLAYKGQLFCVFTKHKSCSCSTRIQHCALKTGRMINIGFMLMTVCREKYPYCSRYLKWVRHYLSWNDICTISLCAYGPRWIRGGGGGASDGAPWRQISPQ